MAFGRAALVLMAACGGSNLEPDASPPIDVAPFVPGPNTVTLGVAFDTPQYIRYRDATGPWTEPTAVAENTYELHITDAYDVLVVCGGTTDLEVEELRRTFSDGPNASIVCFYSGFKPNTTAVFLTGRMMQAGEISFGAYDTSTTGPWDFSLAVDPGIHDLIAVNPTSILLRRDQSITTSGTVPTVDLVQDGASLELRPFTVNSQPAEIVTSALYLTTANEFAALDGTDTNLRAPPSALLLPGDVEEVWIEATADSFVRGDFVQYAGAQSSFSLMPQLTGVAYSFGNGWVLSAGWSALPPYAVVELGVFGYSANRSATQTVDVTKSWIDATHVSNVALDARPPDYDPHWLADLGGPYLRNFTVYETSGSSAGSRYTGLADDINFRRAGLRRRATAGNSRPGRSTMR